ncbi:DNA phosphorothioation system sulfurtransferase DndC [Geomonas azotofigens]|uniref:DNA phosphorothioation system sulfurtransferase DndC n=1 Tax=Geomonas azotofigens TaxID=2843196 RepID=UPI001C11C517|nr:DNA phosphorothioation system sulfurtransferase DndC [Geomonas azotofigens]MBU5612632.1 DNA phosphorothioation system sulfurtransferase DndC [Geomonas azotofigens]
MTSRPKTKNTGDTTSIPTRQHKSAFNNSGFQSTIRSLQEEVCALYTADEVPWIIGYSGGKDSTAILQLVWTALATLPLEQRRKTVYVISTDTMVENPVVAVWVANSLSLMKQSASKQEMPIEPIRLTPALADSFWVNLIGKGYPAPRNKFRWCTARLKIQPSNTFINNVVSSSSEAILVLGTRKAESSKRAANMAAHEKKRFRDRLSPNSSLPGSLVYTPIEDWTNEDVWFYLMQVKNPWGNNNHDLLGMYAGASADGECPLVVDDSTPSCGDSRFGCWVCTLVDKDKSMTAMIQNDEEKEWMMPLLDLRDALDFRRDHEGEYAENADYDIRDFRRMSGAVQVMSGGRPIHGPYIQSAREEWLKKLLIAQTYIRNNGPDEVRGFELITLAELQEIRRIWVVDKHELEDSLPRIYRNATGEEYPGRSLDDNLVIGEEEMSILAQLCGDDHLHYELSRELISLTVQQRSTTRRAGLHERLEKTFSRHFYDNRDDAVSRANLIAEQKKRIRSELPCVSQGSSETSQEDKV